LLVAIFFGPQAAGASSARHSLRPLSGERNETDKPRAKTRGKIADSYLNVIASAAKQSTLLAAPWIASLRSQ
jgi:hypothetical protein